METTQTNTVFASELLQQTADMIKAEGMQVYYSEWSSSKAKPTYFHFTDGKNLGYCQQGYFGGVRFSTVHKPCRECGTGYGLDDDPGTYNPTIQDAKRAFILAPNWANSSDIKAIKKYANWEEYTKRNSMPKYIQY